MFCPECKEEEGKPHKPDCPIGKAEKILLVEKNQEQEELRLENGDCYDEDTGEYLGSLAADTAPMTGPNASLPAQISIFFNGYWYIFQPVSRVKHVEEREGKETL